MAPSIQTQRDNIEIGRMLARLQYGTDLDTILQVALGYSPNSGPPRQHFENRFRSAQRAGRDAFRNREPGYFTFNAMPFGGMTLYRTTWYVWINPETTKPQTIPLFAGDLAPMRRRWTNDLNTRTATGRSVTTADDISRLREAVERNDWAALNEINAQMLGDGSLGEILSGYFGLLYADIQEILPRLEDYPEIHQFQRLAKQVRDQSRKLRQTEAKLAKQLKGWVELKSGVPNNAQQMAIEQAEQRLIGLPRPS